MKSTARTVMLASIAAVALTACGAGQSRLNPVNWFRSSPEAETVAAEEVNVVIDDRPLVEQITALTIERTPGGAIIRATGLPATQGWYAPELVNEDIDGEPVDGILLYSFRAVPPEGPQASSTVQSRELIAAVHVSDIVLARTREIRVTGATNARSARR